jgi:hypothetical protein
MARSSLFAVAAAATLVLAACSEREPESTTGPDFAAGTDPCGFSNSLVTGYFPSSRQSYMLSVKSSMASSAEDSQKRTYGFELMDSIGSVSRNTAFSTSPTAGAELTVAIIGCIFPGNSFTYPTSTNGLSDFTRALNSAAGGAYFVRGGGSSFSGRGATILGTTGGVTGNLSGIAPSTGSSSANWTTMLAGNSSAAKPVDQGVLFYGYNAAAAPTDPVLYEWATVPSELTFTPAAIVSVCDANPANPVVHEEAVGVLFFVTSNICDTPQSLTMNEGWGPRALAARLGRVLADALSPTPLLATTMITAGGGKTSQLPKSKFGKKSLNAVTSTWKQSPLDPGSTWYGTSINQARPVSAYVSATADGHPEAVRFCAYLTGANNNGTPTALNNDLPLTPECPAPPKALSVLTKPVLIQGTNEVDNTQALADFGNVWVTKTGTITITLTVSSGTSVTAAPLSALLYVKPLKK